MEDRLLIRNANNTLIFMNGAILSQPNINMPHNYGPFIIMPHIIWGHIIGASLLLGLIIMVL